MSQPARPQREYPEEAYARPAPPAAPRPKKPSGPVAVEVVEAPPRAMGAAPAPWWFAAPYVLERAFHAFFLPFKLLVWACEVVVSVTFTAMVGSILLWYFDWIHNDQVQAVFQQLVDRLQGILKGAGLM